MFHDQLAFAILEYVATPLAKMPTRLQKHTTLRAWRGGGLCFFHELSPGIAMRAPYYPAFPIARKAGKLFKGSKLHVA